MTIASDLDGTRARITRYMTDRGVVTRPSAERPVLNTATGQLAKPPGTRIYPDADDDAVDGILSVQAGPGMGTLVRVEGGEDTAVRSWVLRLPFTEAALAIERGDVVTLTVAENSQLVGHPMHVHAPDMRTRQATVKLVLTERAYELPG